MNESAAELHLGLACLGDEVQLALVTSAGELLAARVWQSSGSLAADLETALSNAPRGIRALMIATDRLRTALEGGGPLARVATLRVGGPVTTGVPVLVSWPEDLLERIRPLTAIVDGAADSFGAELVPFDEAGAERFFERCVGEVDAVAISSVFAPLTPDFERRAASIAKRVLGESMSVTMSHTVAGFGLLDRENAATLNAALTPLASGMLREIEAAVARHGMDAEIFLAQNDGTLAVADLAVATPIRLLEGATASGIFGTALLSAAAGPTSSTTGLAKAALLREGCVLMTSAPTWVAGTRLNVELPVGAGKAAPSPEADSSSPKALRAGRAQSAAGAQPHAEVSAAYGCALAPVGATAWVVSEDDDREAQLLHRAKQHVIELAIIAGADPSTVAVTGIDAIDTSHAAKRRMRIRATARPLFVSRADRSAPEPLPYTTTLD